LFNRMQEQQRQLEATLHAIPDVLLVVNDDGQILLVNDAALDLTGGMTQEDVVGTSLSGLLHMDSAFAPLQEVLDDPLAHGETRTFETRSERKRKDFVITVSRWVNPFGGTAGYVIVMHDVSQLRDLDRFKSEMLKMASHDLRSPLALIVGYCDLIRMDIPDENSPINEYVDVVVRSTRRMSILLDDLLRVEEIRTSPEELHKPTDFAKLVGAAADTLAMITHAKSQTAETDIRLDGLTPITIDPALIREAMENLISNASKYTPEEGTIRLVSYYEDWRVHFIIEDNGIGIPEHDVTRVFNWGFRSKKAAEQPIEGKGLGLSLVKTVLERHGGEVWVESQEGVGSRFGFWLPR
jgi:PAS domain S-box-containing protein